MKNLKNSYILYLFCYTVPEILAISEVAIFHNKILFDHILERHTGCVQDFAHCGKLCSNHLMCMSFFYKADGLRICQLHSTVLTDLDKAKDAQGWLYYVYDSERCPYQDEYGFVLQRITGLCIRVMTRMVSYQQMKNNCRRLNASVLQLTSFGKEKGVVDLITKLWPDNHYMIIQGTFNQTWQLDDGTKMDYFNWSPGEKTLPKPNLKIMMQVTSGRNVEPSSTWFLTDKLSRPMEYICEKI